MKIAARRRLAVGALATSTAVIAGLLIGPALAAPNGVTVNPSGVVNTNAAAELTFTTTEADLRYDGTAIFTRLGGGVPFELEVFGPILPGASATAVREGTATFNATDGGNGLGTDGPADAGTYMVSITGNTAPIPGAPGGGGNDTCASCFTVLPAGPVSVSSIAPNSLRPGGSGNVSILGNNFERGTRVEVLFPDGSIDNEVNFNNVPTSNGTPSGTPDETQITLRTELLRRGQVAATAQPGIRNIRVVNLDGSSALCSGCFFVAGAPLSGSNPSAAFNDPGQALTAITFTGSNITNGTPRLEFVGTPGAATRQQLSIVGTNVRDYTGTSITADFDLRNAAPGANAYQPFVEGQGGVVNACDMCRFTVTQRENRTPTLVSLDRSNQTGVQKQLRQGESATFVASGTNFSKGANIAFTPPAGLTVTGVEFTSPEAFNITISAAMDAATGDRGARVRLTDGKQSAECGGCLTITQGSGATPGPTASGTPDEGGGSEDFSFSRFSGADRYATAAAIARGSRSTAQTVILANGQNDDPRTSRNESHFPDALAASYLAGNRQAPTLLATETVLPQVTSDALEALQTENVVIVGGPSAISTGIEDELEEEGYTVTRIAGENRYDTASAVAETPPTDYVGEDQDGRRTAVLASGENFADALVAGPLGYAAKFPVLITAKDGLSQQTRDTLEALDIEHVLIAGGTAAVSQATEDQVRASGVTSERFAGVDRYDTAALIAEYAYDSLGFDPAHVDIALGTEFADALAGGPHAGVERAPILLVARDVLPNRTREVLTERGAALEDGEIFGGTAAVTTKVENDAEEAVNSAGAEPEPSGEPAPSGSAAPTAAPSGSPAASGAPAPTAAPSGSPAPTGSPTVAPR